MNVTLEEISACRKRLKIEVPADRVSKAMDRVTDEFQKMARIPGFRPGKAPKGIVQKRFQKDIELELQRTLVPEAYREAIKSRNLSVVSSPHIEDLNFHPGLSLSFSTLVDLVPEFTLPNYTGLVVKKEETTVTDEEVNKTLETLREQRADFKDADPRPLAMEDFAVISYTGAVDGKPITEWVPEAKSLGENPNFWIWLKPDAFLPKFAEQCVGMQIGDRREVQIEFPADFPQQVLAGKKATYQVELKQIKNRILPELNDEMTQEIAGVNLEEFKKKVRENVEAQKQQRAQREHTRQIVDQLLGGVQFDLPESAVAEETQQAVYEIVAENQARGVPAGLLEEKKEEIYKNAAESAKQAVKLKLIANKIAEKEKIALTDDEFFERLQQSAAQQQMPLDKFVDAVSKNGAIHSLREKALLQKVIDFVLQAAKLE